MAERKIAATRFLAAVPHKNAAMKMERLRDGAMVSVPVRRPGWLIPPISWLLPWSDCRRVQLDRPGTEVLDLCDGRRTVEEVVERFSRTHKLSFREGQVAVTQFLSDLLRRGIVALAGTEEPRA